MKIGNTQQDDDEQSQPEVERGLSAVAAAPAKNMAIMIVLGIVILMVFWYAFFAPTEEEKKAEANKRPVEVSNKIATTKPAAAEIETKLTALPALPAPPPLVEPTPPPPPPPLVEESKPQAPVIAPILKDDDDTLSKRDGKLSERRKSSIMLGGGGATGGGGGGGTGKADDSGGSKLSKLLGGGGPGSDPDDDSFTPEHTSAEQQRVTRLGNMASVIAQGKIIDAILETAINTDIPGVLRAVISRDVYAEAGKRILIPKGSRLIGAYQADVKVGQKRVNIIWNRVILPNGLDIAIESPGTDQLGRAGMEGLVDNKFKELFTSAILVSTISTGFAVAAQNLTGGGEDSTTSTSTGSNGTTTTTTSDATEQAIAGAAQQIGQVGATITQQMINTKPTITIDQGSRVKVFVNRDLVFSNDIANNVRFVR